MGRRATRLHARPGRDDADGEDRRLVADGHANGARVPDGRPRVDRQRIRCVPERGWRAYASLMSGMLMRTPAALAGITDTQADPRPGREGRLAPARVGFDAHDYLYQSRAYDAHDVGTTPGFAGTSARARLDPRGARCPRPPLDLFNPAAAARAGRPAIPGAPLRRDPLAAGPPGRHEPRARGRRFPEPRRPRLPRGMRERDPGPRPAVAVRHLPSHHRAGDPAGDPADPRELRALAVGRRRAHQPAGAAVLVRGASRLAAGRALRRRARAHRRHPRHRLASACAGWPTTWRCSSARPS